jgi:hypothetical protein
MPKLCRAQRRWHAAHAHGCAVQKGCVLGHVRSNVLITRADNKYLHQIQAMLLLAAENPNFAHLFDTPHADNAIFSSFTTGLLQVNESASDYLGNFKHVMDGFEKMAAARDNRDASLRAAITANPDPTPPSSLALGQVRRSWSV